MPMGVVMSKGGGDCSIGIIGGERVDEIWWGDI